MQHKNQDFILWNSLRNEDPDAFDKIYDQYIDALYAYGLSYSKDKELVKDCVHDLFLDLYKYRKRLSSTDNIKFYLFKSLKRKIFSRNKNKLRIDYHDIILDSAYPVSTSTEEEIIAGETQKEIMETLANAINRLPERQHEGIILKFRNELSYEEIAQIMEISIESARTLVYRSIKALRQEMDEKNF